jgi:hypothetical protein
VLDRRRRGEHGRVGGIGSQERLINGRTLKLASSILHLHRASHYRPSTRHDPSSLSSIMGRLDRGHRRLDCEIIRRRTSRHVIRLLGWSRRWHHLIRKAGRRLGIHRLIFWYRRIWPVVVWSGDVAIGVEAGVVVLVLGRRSVTLLRRHIHRDVRSVVGRMAWVHVRLAGWSGARDKAHGRLIDMLRRMIDGRLGKSIGQRVQWRKTGI